MVRARRSRKKAKSSSANLIAGVGIFFVFLAFVAYFWFETQRAKEKALDPLSMCQKGSPIGYFSLVIDTTDPLSATQLRIGKQLINSKISEIPVGTFINMITVNPDAQVREKSYYGVCKPARGEQANQLVENPRLVEEKFQKQFINPINKALEAMLETPEATSSPIIETIYSLVSRSPKFVVADTRKQLFILSDLAQHSDTFSFFRGDSWQSFHKSGKAHSIGDMFKGGEVTVVRVPLKTGRNEILEDFWVKYFDQMQVGSLKIEQISDIGDF